MQNGSLYSKASESDRMFTLWRVVLNRALTGFLTVVILPCWAGAETRLSGRITDENNAPISGARVTFTRHVADGQSGAEVQHALSDPTGSFVFEIWWPGDYTVVVEKTGYFRLESQFAKARLLETNPANEIHLILNRLRDVSESVNVSASRTGIEMDHTAAAQEVNGMELLSVPYPASNNLRNATRILPGVVRDSNGGMHLNGAAENQTLYTLDGFNISDPLTGKFESRLSVEAVQSMDVISGRPAAEYGKGSAGVFAVNTKMGGDKIRFSATNFFPGVENRKGLVVGSWNPRFNVLGPIRKGRAWFSDSITAQYGKDVVPELPRGQDRSSSWRIGNYLHTQVNLKPANILYAGFLGNYFQSARTGLGALDPLETTVDRRARQWFFSVKDQIYRERGSLVELGFASNRTFSRDIPQGHDLYRLTAFGRRGNYFIDSTREASRDQWLVNYFLPSFALGGGHQMKIGADLDRLDFWQHLRRTGFEQLREDSSLSRRVLFGGNGLVGRSNFETSAYVQDSWRMRPNLLLEIGLRSDWDQILRNWSWSPRLGLAWSPRWLEHTKISGGYAVVYDATNLQLFTRQDDQYAITTYFPRGLAAPYPVLSLYSIDQPHFATPRYRNLSGTVEQILPAGFSARVNLLHRRGDRGLSYFGGLESETRYSLLNGRRDVFDSLELTVRQTLKKQYEWLVSYTRSRAVSNAVVDATVDNPLIVPSNAGRMPWDTPNRFLSWGFLPTRWPSWSVAYLLEWRSGFPFSVLSEDGRVLGSPSSSRYPDFFELNLHLEKRFQLRGNSWAWRMGLDNITSHRNPTVVNNDVGSSQFMRFYGGQDRALNIRVRWLGKL